MLFKGYKQPGVVKDVDLENNIVTGYFSIFNIEDDDGDLIQPGAFSKTIAEKGQAGTNRIKHLHQHKTDEVLSKPKLQEDERGLYFESEIVQTTLGRDVMKLYDNGVLDEHSIGFMPVKEVFDREREVNIIKEIDLWEGSTVTWGAQMQARVDAKELKHIKSKIDRIRKELHTGNYTDKTFENLEGWLQKLVEIEGTQDLPQPHDSTGSGGNEPSEVDSLKELKESIENL
jgi:HK97 family phage prohead protease